MTGEESTAGNGAGSAGGVATGRSGGGLGILPIVVVAIVVAAAIGGIFLMNKTGEPDLEPGEISATLIIDYGNGTVEWYNLTTVNNSVPGLMDEAIGADNYTMNRYDNGVYCLMNIKGHGDTTQTEYPKPPGSKYWRLYLDGELAPVSSNTFNESEKFGAIQDGQVVKLVWEAAVAPSGIISAEGVSVDVIIDYGNGTVVSLTVTTQNFTALGCLEAAVGYENLDLQDFGYGWFVNGINGFNADNPPEGAPEAGSYYWAFYIENEYASVGAGQYVCEHGETIKFGFEGY